MRLSSDVFYTSTTMPIEGPANSTCVLLLGVL